MKYFLTVIIPFHLGLLGTAGANTIELQIQSPYHETLERLFYGEAIGRPLPIDTLGLQEGEEKEYRGTCLSYRGLPAEDSIKIQLLTNRKCLSLGKIFVSDTDNPIHCTPASIAVTSDGHKSHKMGNAISVVSYEGAVHIIHAKNPLATLEESIYCSYPVAQDG